MRSAGRIVLGVLLVIEGLVTAVRLAGLAPQLAVYDWIADALIASRALVGALALTTGAWLLSRRPAAITLARWALVLSAALTTLEIGFRLAPSDLEPSLRWPVVVLSWLYAAGWLLWLRRLR